MSTFRARPGAPILAEGATGLSLPGPAGVPGRREKRRGNGRDDGSGTPLGFDPSSLCVTLPPQLRAGEATSSQAAGITPRASSRTPHYEKSRWAGPSLARPIAGFLTLRNVAADPLMAAANEQRARDVKSALKGRNPSTWRSAIECALGGGTNGVVPS